MYKKLDSLPTCLLSLSAVPSMSTINMLPCPLCLSRMPRSTSQLSDCFLREVLTAQLTSLLNGLYLGCWPGLQLSVLTQWRLLPWRLVHGVAVVFGRKHQSSKPGPLPELLICQLPSLGVKDLSRNQAEATIFRPCPCMHASDPTHYNFPNILLVTQSTLFIVEGCHNDMNIYKQESWRLF